MQRIRSQANSTSQVWSGSTLTRFCSHVDFFEDFLQKKKHVHKTNLNKKAGFYSQVAIKFEFIT